MDIDGQLELKVGDTIECFDKDDLVDTFQALQKEGVDTDFLYEKDGKRGLWLIVLSVEGSENG